MKWEKMQIGDKVCVPGSPECVRFDILPFGFFLMIRQEYPDSKIAWGIANGYSQFRAVMVDDRIVFLARLGMMPWLPAYFHRASATCKTPPIPVGNKGLPLHILLVDAATGRVKARRVDTLDAKLAHKLCSLISSQDPEDPLRNDQIMLNRIKHRYSPIQLAALANLNWRIKSY